MSRLSVHPEETYSRGGVTTIPARSRRQCQLISPVSSFNFWVASSSSPVPRLRSLPCQDHSSGQDRKPRDPFLGKADLRDGWAQGASIEKLFSTGIRW